MALIEILTLGGFQVRRSGELVAGFESDTVRILLAYLVVESAQPIRRETLAALFWPDAREATARANLRWAISNLRKVIGDRAAVEPVFLVTRQTIHRNPAASIRSDALDFLALHHEENSDIKRLEAAARLYRGELLAGINPKNSLPLDEWLLLKRENLARLFAEILDRLIQSYLDQDDIQRAILYARRLVELEPWQERGQRLLMRLFSANGQRNAALEQYRNYQKFAMETLGVDPESETTRLYKHIQQNENNPQGSTKHNLTMLLPPLIGRQTELDVLQSWLLDPTCRGITITGAGGIGKTHLSIELAKPQIEEYRDGVYFIDLRALDPEQSIIPAIAEALKFTFVRGDDLRTQLIDYLVDKELLLVLDNFEHLRSQTGVVVALLGHVSGMKVVISSRVRLTIPGVRIYQLKGLVLVRDIQSPSESSAVELFVDAARRTHPDYSPTPDDLPTIVEVCELVSGIPLGIILAAAWIDVLSAEEIAGAIRQNYAVLETDRAGVPVRHRNLRGVFQSSWYLLDAGGQQVLAALSVFRGDFSRQAAQEVTGASLSSIQQLIGQSLINWSATGCLQLHELLRQFAADRLAQAPEEKLRAHTRHSTYYLSALTHWVKALKGLDQNNALDELRADFANILAAWDWAVDQGDADRLLTVVDGLCWYLLWQVRYEQGADLCGNSLAAFYGIPETRVGVQRLRVRLLIWQGRFLHLTGEKKAGSTSLISAQEVIDRLSLDGEGVDFELGLIRHMSGKAVESMDRPLAKSFYLESLDYFRQGNHRWEAAYLLSALGGIAWNLGNYPEAESYHRQALNERTSLNDVRGIATSSMAMGITLLHQGRFSEALPLVEEGCRLRRQVGDRLGTADSLRNLGWTHMLLGDFDKAVALLEESVSIYQSLGLRYGLEMSMLAEALGHIGEFELARKWCDRGLEAARSTGYQRALGHSLMTQGELALAMGEIDLASCSLQESLEIHQQTGQREELCRVWIVIALTEMESGNQSRCAAALTQAHVYLHTSRAFIPLLYYMPAVAKWKYLCKEADRDGQKLRSILGYPIIQNSQWFKKVFAEMDFSIRYVSQHPDPGTLWKMFEDIS